MTHTLTIQLSDQTYYHLKQAAELAQQPVDVIVEHSLSHSLPPLLEEIPAVYQSDVYPLLSMSETELVQETHRRLPAAQWAEYEALLDKKKLTRLSDSEQAKLDSLRREADIVTFRKGYAAVLLQRRGQRLPTLAELSLAA